MKKTLALMLILTIILVGCKSSSFDGDQVKVDLYLMSFCPFGNQAEEIMEPVYDAIKEAIDFNAHYVIYSNYRGGGPVFCLDDEDKYCSMHGIYELNQGLRELCVANHIGYDEWFDFIKEINKKCTYLNADHCWRDIAKELNLDVDLIQSCEKEEGLSLAAEELALNKQNGVRGSPSLFINGKSYNGQRSPQHYLKAICEQFENEPSGCNKVLATPQVAPSGAGCG